MPVISDESRPWWVLIGTCLALFVLMLDSTEVVLALPVARELDLSPPGVQWVQNAYLLVLAATVVTCGRLGDILGRHGSSSRALPCSSPGQSWPRSPRTRRS